MICSCIAWKVVIISCVVLQLTAVNGTLSKSDKKAKKAKQKDNSNVKSVFERGLVEAQTQSADILKEYYRYCEAERDKTVFKGKWNSKGYDIAKVFSKKFDLVSPVWLQVVSRPNNEFEILGGHDIDSGWAIEVMQGRDNLMVPRVLFDKWSLKDYENLFSREEFMAKCAKVITSFIKKHNFAGITLELWNQMPTSMQMDATHFIIDLSEILHKAEKSLTLIIPPLAVQPSSRVPQFTKENFEELKSSVDYFNIMTYDYHMQSSVAGPISPIKWIEESITAICPEDHEIDRAKILLGLNFYGIRFGEFSGAQPILGHDFVDILKSNSPAVKWQPKDEEHLYLYKNSKNGENLYLFYPSLLSIKKRIDLAKRLGTGIGIWEIGQGLDYFYDLL
ncbi:CHID1 [Bugula neritina]|uniref:Chitinase domain-containing protein 1 n=1 Tax=Bugula neritina TaxID=10212 RepID=A0A7J7J2I2_BUGNE|nr:CHID1 [Bugula neritina]